MRHNNRFLHTYTSTSCLLLISLLVASPAALTAARHSRLDLSENAQEAATAADSTAGNLPTAKRQQAAAAATLADDKVTSEATAAAIAFADTAPNDLAMTQADAKLVGITNGAKSIQSVSMKDAKTSPHLESIEKMDAPAANASMREDEETLQQTKELPNETVDEEIEFFDNSLANSEENLENNIQDCNADFIGFEITTGFVFSAPGKMLKSLPGTLMLTDCLSACRKDVACRAVNYETGLCVLFSANADKLPGALAKSQFPVFTLYAQKSCLRIRPCARDWSIDRVQGYKLNGYVKRTIPVLSRQDCFELCLGEAEFTCRSASYYRHTKSCELSEMDRITLSGRSAFQSLDAVDYLENNCADEPNKLCEFKRLPGRILKTVDSVFQDIGTIDECRDLCLNAPYRCHSYDYGDTGDMVCRLSHHSRITLTDIQDPYLDVPEATTYELSSCYNVTIECGAADMIARIRTSKLFDGKVYAKGSPKSCAVDVKNALDFEIRMGYQNLECNVHQSSSGRYMNDVVIQHHDKIVTSSDLGLAVTCQYDLTNKSITNEVLLDVKDDYEPALSEEVIVDSPNVLMKITSRDGTDVMRTAEVGDPLALKFEILDAQSPYEIFVRELVAMDGNDNAEITLIDSNGCPTDHFIMGPIYKSSTSGKILLSHFDAFKFPTSELVQFRALVTPCMPTCEPVQCDQSENGGEYKSMVSYGRRRRSLNVTATFAGTVHSSNAQNQQQLKPVQQQQRFARQQHLHLRSRRATAVSITKSQPSQDDMLLVQSIQITDKFGFDKQQQQKQAKLETIARNVSERIDNEADQGHCVNAIGLILTITVFLLTQLAVIAVWSHLRQQHRQPYTSESLSSTSTYVNRKSLSTNNSTLMPKSVPKTRTESLSKVYDRAFDGRHGRQF
ncbi:uncharacterized protein LOC128855489 [Anastrepha ludens]|uniref:uncharacterized protein LOC128855489 n=1 Tax=Anastrepha ludens TaxID=28586 RepID=UPI0023B1C81D|nr:uncharacterized protein LOC128855489 [Anastrepha ludens]